MMKKWLILVLSLLIVNTISFSVFNLDNAPAQAGVSVTAHVSAICGNDIEEEGEQCDGSDLGGQTCVGLGYYGGTLACKADCTFDTSGCTTTQPPAAGGPAPVPTVTKVVLQGKAYPTAKITILIDGKVATIITADSLANFKAEITNITAGVWSFGLWAEDKEGRRSITFSFTTTITKDMTTTVSGIFIPPAIEIEKTNILRGETLKILGQTAPQSEISIFIADSLVEEIIKKTTAEADGTWSYDFDTSILEEDSYTIRAKAALPDEGLLSSFSQVLKFYLKKIAPPIICPYGDLNKDGRTNMIDFSILLYWWEKYDVCADQNMDGIVNLADFSIMLYWWTG